MLRELDEWLSASSIRIRTENIIGCNQYDKNNIVIDRHFNDTIYICLWEIQGTQKANISSQRDSKSQTCDLWC